MSYPNVCIKCGYQWNAKVPNPKRCPNCNCRTTINRRTTPSKTIQEHLEKYVEIAYEEYKKMPYLDQLNTDLLDMLWKEGKRQFPDVPPLRLEKICRKILINFITKQIEQKEQQSFSAQHV